MRQYEAARDAVWRGARRRQSLAAFKSVYSIFVSRLDVYTEKAVPGLSPAAQGQVGIVNAKRIWAANRKFWQANNTPLAQEMIFASTGTKKPEDPPWKYVEAFAGSDIETNPPATNEAVEKSGRTITRHVDATAAAAGAGRNRRQSRHAKAGRNAHGRGAEEICRPATRPAALDRGQARAIGRPLDSARLGNSASSEHAGKTSTKCRYLRPYESCRSRCRGKSGSFHRRLMRDWLRGRCQSTRIDHQSRCSHKRALI